MQVRTGQFSRIEYFDASHADGSAHTLLCTRYLGIGWSDDWSGTPTWHSTIDDGSDDLPF